MRKAEPAPVTRARIPQAEGDAVAFQYTGKTSLTVISPITLHRYRFARTGIILRADPRDHGLLANVPNLRQLETT
jgi:hypothetical protein